MLSHGPGHSVADDREYDAATSESVSYFTEASKSPIVFADGRNHDPGGGVGGERAAFAVLTIDGK